jgi:hypothetical protein
MSYPPSESGIARGQDQRRWILWEGKTQSDEIGDPVTMLELISLLRTLAGLWGGKSQSAGPGQLPWVDGGLLPSYRVTLDKPAVLLVSD